MSPVMMPAVDRLYQQIAQAIAEERIVFTIHADNQLNSRGVLRWQAVAGFEEGKLLLSVPDAKPNPKILIRQTLPDATPVVAVWSYVRSIQMAQLVTLYFEDQ